MLYFGSTDFCTNVINNYNFVFLLFWYVLLLTICLPFHPPVCLSIYLVHPSMIVHSDLLYQVSVVLLLCSLLCRLVTSYDHFVSLRFFLSGFFQSCALGWQCRNFYGLILNCHITFMCFWCHTTNSVSCNCLYSPESFVPLMPLYWVQKDLPS